MNRGKHRSTCKQGKKTVNALLKIDGIKSVIIGISHGGKGLHQARDGAIKLQVSKPGAISAVMQTSKGIQDINILLESDIDDEAIRALISNTLGDLLIQ